MKDEQGWGLGWFGPDEARAIFHAALWLAFYVVLAYIATHPETVTDLWYRARLWWAYRQAPPNVDKLRHMRALRWAGYYDADLVADEETSG